MEVIDQAIPCPKCKQYYPGDCFDDGCKDPLCQCDGCTTLRCIEYEDMIQEMEANNDE